jgi:hypothetical protein
MIEEPHKTEKMRSTGTNFNGSGAKRAPCSDKLAADQHLIPVLLQKVLPTLPKNKFRKYECRHEAR